MDSSWLSKVLLIEKEAYTNPWTERVMANELNRAGSIRLGYICESELLAYALSRCVVDELHILNLAVASDFRRQGIAGEMLNSTLDEARRLAASTAILEVRESNLAAQRLYKTFGFKLIGARERYYSDNGETALVLRCSI